MSQSQFNPSLAQILSFIKNHGIGSSSAISANSATAAVSAPPATTATGVSVRALESAKSDIITNLDYPMKDVVIVGAGIVGLGLAYLFQCAGVRCTLVDPRVGEYSREGAFSIYTADTINHLLKININNIEILFIMCFTCNYSCRMLNFLLK